MKSYAHQTLPEKRIKKLAAKFTDEEIRASLQEDAENRAYIDEQANCVGYWNAYNGPMLVMDDDSVRAYAQLEFLRRHRYPSFRTDAQVRGYAKEHGWPVRSRADLGGKR